MNGRLEAMDLHRATEEANGWKEAVKRWERIGKIELAISAGTGGGLATTNELLRLESTHTAVTWDEGARVGDRLTGAGGDPEAGAYEIVYSISGGRRRMRQLFLKKMEVAK